MLHGCLVARIVSAPLRLASAGQTFVVQTPHGDFDMLSTHDLASKAKRQIKPGLGIFMVISGIADDHLTLSAFDIVQPELTGWNLFSVCGPVVSWPDSHAQGPHVNLQLARQQLRLLAPEQREWLNSLDVADEVQAWGRLERSEDRQYRLIAERMERVQTQVSKEMVGR